jgi:RNA-binding, Nab2-type zinc finger
MPLVRLEFHVDLLVTLLLSDAFIISAKFCRNGTRDECPIEKCRFQHAKPTFLYSSAAKASLPPPTTPTPVNTPTANGFQAKPCRYGTRDNCPNEKCRFQHAEPDLPLMHPAPNAGTGVKSIPVDYGDIENLVRGR